MRFIGRFVRFLLGILIVPFLLYCTLIVLGAAIAVNPKTKTNNPDITVYLISNGVHVDIAVPVKSKILDWTKMVQPHHTLEKPAHSRYVSFGWGDLEFYQKTPNWEDLTVKTALKALFCKTPSAIHTRFYDDIAIGEKVKPLRIDTIQYRRLSEYIQNSFLFDEEGKSQPVMGLHYDGKDAFYKARGSLSLFKTCNTWVNEALKHAGLKACLWTPLEQGIFLRYQ